MNEWHTIPGFEFYQINRSGQVRRVVPGDNGCKCKILKSRINQGYWKVNLQRSFDRKMIYCGLHRLLAIVFIGPAPTLGHVVAHNDGNPLNNELSNLRWATPKENQADRWKPRLYT